MKTISYTSKYNGEKYKLMFVHDSYSNNGNDYYGLICEDGAPFCDVTVNLDFLMPGFAFIDVNNMPSDLVEQLEKKGFYKRTGRIRPSGYVNYPLCELNIDLLEQYSCKKR